MNTPLYQQHKAPHKLEQGSHAGLWFERFFNQYEANWEIIKENPKLKKKDGKKAWIDTVTDTHGERKQLEQFQNRQETLISALKGQSQRYQTDWNFVSGMGNPHPVENGFSWHPTLAVPYLAGSAVKGLVRAWVEMNDDALSDDEKDARLISWFGTADKEDAAEKTGDLIFFDAIPDKPATLVCDIMTPHMGGWYQNDKGSSKSGDIPADWHEPTPIPFLAVKNARFIFSIAPRGEDKNNQLTQVFEALENALQWLGAGAKTAAGYGYMSHDISFEQAKLEKQAEQERAIEQQRKDDEVAEKNKNRSPLAQEYFIAAHKQDWDTNKDLFMHTNGLDAWLDKLEQQEENEKDILEDLIRLINKHYKAGLLDDPEKPEQKIQPGKGKKKKEKKKPAFKENQLKMAARVRALQAKP